MAADAYRTVESASMRPPPTAIVSTESAVSWGAILAGAAGGAALSLALLVLGTGFGLSALSPWSGQGASAHTIGTSAIVWLIFTQLAASAVGGYLAGRLRTRWVSVHSDEVYFRDTAHGLLSWAVATLVTAACLGSAVGGITGTAAPVAGTAMLAAPAGAGAAMATGAGASSGPSSMVEGAGQPGPGRSGPAGSGAALQYYVDGLYRPADGSQAAVSTSNEPGAPISSDTVAAAQTTRILAQGLRAGSLPDEDVRYVGGMVAQRTGLSQQDAQRRVTDTFSRVRAALDKQATEIRQQADEARRAASHTLLWMFAALLIGAFVASLMATYGGRRRDA